MLKSKYSVSHHVGGFQKMVSKRTQRCIPSSSTDWLSLVVSDSENKITDGSFQCPKGPISDVSRGQPMLCA